MSGKNATTQFRDTFGTESTFAGGTKNPSEIGIVGLDPSHPLYIKGLDVPLDTWNEDLWDQARLSLALSDPIDPAKFLMNIEAGAQIDPVRIVKRRELVLAFNGRRRILAGRGANKLLIKRGEQIEGLIALPVIADKSTDVELGVRLANEGGLIEPPYIKAANAARLRTRGRSDEQILAVYPIEPNTLANWFAYADNLSPAIKALIEQGPKAERLPFAIGVELAKWSGKGEHKAQEKALDYLRAQGAKLTGERGRENAKNVIRAVMAGTLDQGGPKVTSDDEPPSVPPPPEQNPTRAHDPAGAARDAATAPPPPSSGPKRSNGPKVTTEAPKLSWPAIRQVTAHLEPSDADPHKTSEDRLASAIMSVITGQDPTADGLAEWPRVQSKFRKVVRSGDGAPAVVTARPATPPAVKAANVPQDPKEAEKDTIRSIPCPNVKCKGGRDQATRNLCNTCHGYTKISPARVREITATKKK